MSAFGSLLTRSYAMATTPVRWIWATSAKASNRYPIVVLNYHRVSDTSPGEKTIATADFSRQLEWLSKNFDMVSLQEVQKRINGGIDRPTAAITFDGGYADNSLMALPLLVKQQIPATYFVNSESVLRDKELPSDSSDHQSLQGNGIESLQLLEQSGIEIGSQGKSLTDLGKVNAPETLFEEVVDARDELETYLEKPIRYFSFPLGTHESLNDEVFRLAKRFGFDGVCSAYGGYNEIGGDSFHLHRIPADPCFDRFRCGTSLDPRMSFRRRYPTPDLMRITNERERRKEVRSEIRSSEIG
jgi:peptidoglycan/xylan/chitin deacetylase (PgdA/CDA1 family)